MASELNRHLAEIADRGEWRGADTVMAAARTDLDGSWMSLSPERRRVPGWVVAVSAAALVLVLVGGVALWSAAKPGIDVVADAGALTTALTSDATVSTLTTEAVTTTSGVAPTTTTATKTTVLATPARLEITWQQAPLQSAFEPFDVIRSVIAGGPGLVAVGATETEDGGVQTAVWTSADGSRWERAAGLDGFHNMLDDVVAGPSGLVAVSFRNSGFEDFGEEDPPIWISEDGTSWSRVAGNQLAFGDRARITAIAAGGPGYVAVGTDSSDSGLGDAAIWVSADGLAWTRVQDSLGDGFESSVIHDVVATNSGLVAVGHGGDGNWYFGGSPRPFGRQVVWTSKDGVNWNRGDLSSENGWPESIAAGDETTIAVGYAGSILTAWISGAEALEFSAHRIIGGSSTFAEQVLIDGDRLLTVGYDYPATGLAWASNDGGTTWFEVTRIAESEEGPFGDPLDQVSAGFRAVTAFDNGFVAVGGTGNGSTPVWIGAWNEN